MGESFAGRDEAEQDGSGSWQVERRCESCGQMEVADELQTGRVKHSTRESSPSLAVALPSLLKGPAPDPFPPKELLVTRFSRSLTLTTGALEAGAAAAAGESSGAAGRLPSALAEGG